MVQDAKKIISIRIGSSDEHLMNWLRQFPKQARATYLAERIESVLSGKESGQLVIDRGLFELDKPVVQIAYSQRENMVYTNRFINYINNNPDVGKLSYCLKMVAKGYVIIPREEWIKESAYIVPKSKRNTQNNERLQPISVRENHVYSVQANQLHDEPSTTLQIEHIVHSEEQIVGIHSLNVQLESQQQENIQLSSEDVPLSDAGRRRLELLKASEQETNVPEVSDIPIKDQKEEPTTVTIQSSVNELNPMMRQRLSRLKS